MIPSTVGFLDRDFEIKEEQSFTYKMQSKENLIRGYIDGLEAVKQSIFKIIMTERYQYIMYSWNYGIELVDLFGEPISYVCPELKRRISEALLWDDRIKEPLKVSSYFCLVPSNEFDASLKGSNTCLSFCELPDQIGSRKRICILLKGFRSIISLYSR